MKRVAVVTDDHETVAGHFGRARFYDVYEIEGERIERVASIDRSATIRHAGARDGHGDHHDHHDHDHDGDRHHTHDHGPMIAPIADCHVLVAVGMGPPARAAVEGAGIALHRVAGGAISDALAELGRVR